MHAANVRLKRVARIVCAGIFLLLIVYSVVVGCCRAGPVRSIPYNKNRYQQCLCPVVCHLARVRPKAAEAKVHNLVHNLVI